MRYPGRVWKTGSFWAIEVPILGIVTQGRSKKDALDMICDAIESLINKDGFSVQVFPGKDDYFEIGSDDPGILNAFMLRRLRLKNKLTLKEVAKRLGAKSHNAYARYEQGKSIPTIEKLSMLIAAINPEHDFVVSESRVQK